MKDLLAYLKTIDNGQDDLAVRRIINIPKRGIGAASINKVALYAQEQEISFYDALCVAEQVPGLGKAAAKIRPFVLFIQSMKAKAKLLSVADLLQEVIETTGYVRELEAEGTDEAEARIENIDELISKAVDYAEGEEAPTLNGFLENVALVADIDSFDENSDYVVLKTLHSAKDLNFRMSIWQDLRTDCFRVICLLRVITPRPRSRKNGVWHMWELPVQRKI